MLDPWLMTGFPSPPTQGKIAAAIKGLVSVKAKVAKRDIEAFQRLGQRPPAKPGA